MVSKELLEILACPQCKSEKKAVDGSMESIDLEYKEAADKLVCYNCGLVYRVEDDIPVMLIDEAEKFDVGNPPQF